ncbi:hypothetical protein Bca4012_066840 [Brassica carinata]|uniref:CTLH domain-containing protein n=1 Tax=Brassica carinata TaxID=52824 RepID=A0A8X8AZC7_BRACI|nr:hypothetical protein Bca52824_019120 [Brassica carinata]
MYDDNLLGQNRIGNEIHALPLRLCRSSVAITPSPPVPASRSSQLTESLKLEHQLLRVPFEHYKKTIRANHRYLEKEVTSIVSSFGNLVADNNDWSKDVAVSRLTSLVSRLQGLKRKLEEGSNVENLQVQRCRARIDYLESADADNITGWNNTKLKRILVNNILVSLPLSLLIGDMTEKVIDALKRREVASALAWCADNRTRLKKSTSKFEFQLRLQEFIELVRADSYKQAIHYARKHLKPWGAIHMNELQHVLATLVFKSTTECTTYNFPPKTYVYRYIQIVISSSFMDAIKCPRSYYRHASFLKLLFINIYSSFE